MTRVEFQCRREYLKTMQTNTVQDLIYQIADLWRNLTYEWLILREIGNDSHRDRWALTEFWKLVQDSLDCFGEITGITRLTQQRPKYQKISRQLRGHLVSLFALAMGSMKYSNHKMVHRQIINLIEHFIKDPDFEDDVDRRKAKFSGMDD